MTAILDQEVTDADLAALAGITTRRIRQLAEVGRLTRIGRNRYNLSDAFQALIEEMSGGDRASELTAERIRKLRADANLAELEYAKAKGLVAPISECQKEWENYCATLRAGMLNIPTRAVMSLLNEPDERRFKAVLTDEIKLALTAAANAQNNETEDEE